MTKRLWNPVAILVTVFLFLALVTVATSNWTRGARASNSLRLADATLIVEVNATEGDAGLQFFLDGDPWKAMTISDPDGRTILDISARGRLQDWGLTELFSESSEPPFDVVPLAEFKKRFPEGKYTFVGTTVEGERLTGKANLSHDIPDGPRITSPEDGASVARNSVVVVWEPVAEPPGIDIIGYRVIVERENPLRVFSVELPAPVTSVRVPTAFLESGTEYLLEIQAIEASGNQTFTELTFQVS